MRLDALAEDRYSAHTAYHESASRTEEANRMTTRSPERDTKTSTEPSLSLAPAHITISDEAYRLYSQYPKITNTEDERSIKATDNSGDVSRSSSYVVSRAQAAYSQAQAHANSFASTKSEEEAAHNTHEPSSGDRENNWIEDVAKVAGRISAGAATAAVLTSWLPEIAGVADAVSLVSGTVALSADFVLSVEHKQSPAVVGLDVAALVPALGVLKEGTKVAEGIKDLSHAIQPTFRARFSGLCSFSTGILIPHVELDSPSYLRAGGFPVVRSSSLVCHGACARFSQTDRRVEVGRDHRRVRATSR